MGAFKFDLWPKLEIWTNRRPENCKKRSKKSSKKGVKNKVSAKVFQKEVQRKHAKKVSKKMLHVKKILIRMIVDVFG